MPGKRCSGLNGERNVVGWVGLARRVVFEVRGAVNTRDEQLRLPERGRKRSCWNSSNQTTAEGWVRWQEQEQKIFWMWFHLCPITWIKINQWWNDCDSNTSQIQERTPHPHSRNKIIYNLVRVERERSFLNVVHYIHVPHTVLVWLTMIIYIYLVFQSITKFTLLASNPCAFSNTSWEIKKKSELCQSLPIVCTGLPVWSNVLWFEIFILTFLKLSRRSQSKIFPSNRPPTDKTKKECVSRYQ